MSSCVLRPRRQVCQLCDFITTRTRRVQQPLRQQRLLSTTYPITKSAKAQAKAAAESASKRKSRGAGSFDAASLASRASRFRPTTSNVSFEELELAVKKAQATCANVLATQAAPPERELLRALQECESAANLLSQDHTFPSVADPVGAILSLGDSSKPSTPHHTTPIYNLISSLSLATQSLIVAPQTFISPGILKKYVSIQTTLHNPSLLPEALYLYANKPLPIEGSTPIRFTPQNPHKVANAVPFAVANQALQSAISAKLLPVAMDIVDLSYGTTASRRAKFVRKGLLPATALGCAPFAAYAAASQLALIQDTMDPALATNMAFAGILAYVGFTATIGVVVVTTANDQMERVTWAQGLPLRERWVREEERAAVDRMAMAWGFKEKWRRGEEEGLDWETLREWAGAKGMIVDAAELMEGME